MRLTLIREGSLLSSVCQVKSSSNNILTEKPRITFVQVSEQSMAPSSWHTKGAITAGVWSWLCQLMSYVSVNDCLSASVSVYIQWVALSGSTTAFTPRPGPSSSPQSESHFCPTLGQLCSGAHVARAETLAGPHHGLRLCLPNPAPHSFSLSHPQ